MSKKKTLEDIFNDDEFGILDSKAKNSNIKTKDEPGKGALQGNCYYLEGRNNKSYQKQKKKKKKLVLWH